MDPIVMLGWISVILGAIIYTTAGVIFFAREVRKERRMRRTNHRLNGLR